MVFAVQAAPLSRRCSCHDCDHSINSGSVSLGSTTRIVPVVQVTPITRLQTVIQTYPPIVQSMCPQPLVSGGPSVPLEGNDRFRSSLDQAMRLSRERFLNRLCHVHGLANPEIPGSAATGPAQALVKRGHVVSESESKSSPECIPSTNQSCQLVLPTSTTEMGSMVQAEPSTVVQPSTTFASHVQSKAAEISAAVAQHTDLQRGYVNLSSNTMIQPVTKVIPTTTYQPSVAQKATMIEAHAPEHQILPVSSATLGSTVVARPVTTIEPWTILQPKIKSLPFIIHDEGCRFVYMTLQKGA
ncbi:hypothetical protein B0O80DRAFT_423684 [Mortierella sp. GBAus27b]|nr:hypothetical protein B0O80DRAFT_423684 [Mortierella sp. GBAus27b]